MKGCIQAQFSGNARHSLRFDGISATGALYCVELSVYLLDITKSIAVEDVVVVGFVPMIRALTLVWNPGMVWENIIRDRKTLGMVFAFYFVPLMLVAAVGEGFTLIHWRMWTVGAHGLMHFGLAQTLVFEAMRSVLTCVIVALCSYVIWLLKDPFYARYDFPHALMLVMYSLSPLFLSRALTGLPQINLWLSWGAGMYLSMRVFYHGVQSLSKTDPRSANGLFLTGSAAIIALTGVQRFMLIQCLTGHGSSINSFICDLAARM